MFERIDDDDNDKKDTEIIDNIITIDDNNHENNNSDKEKKDKLEIPKQNIKIKVVFGVRIKFIFFMIVLSIFIMSFNKSYKKIKISEKDKTDLINKERTDNIEQEKTDQIKTDKTDQIKTDKTDQIKSDKTDQIKTDKVEKDKTDKIIIEKTDNIIKDKTDEVEKDKPEKILKRGLNRTSILEKYKGKRFDIKEDNRNTAIENGLKYMDKCVKYVIDQEIPKYPENHIPLLSIVIPVYNAEKSIAYAVRSIQNQNLVDFEIILVNDLSKDNSYNMMINLQKEDSRIKILNNTKNMGTLYSRSIGALIAKGDFTFSLDNDDLFLVPELFEVLYILAYQGNFDIISFRAFQANSYKPRPKDIHDDGILDNRHNLVLTQPRLGLSTIYNWGRFSTHDIYVWGKIIKTEIYQKSVNALGEERYSEFITWSEDNIMSYIIYNYAKTYKSIRKYGIFHIRLDSCESNSANYDRRIIGKILFSDVIYDFSRDNDKNMAVESIFNIMNERYFNIQNNKKNSDYFKKFAKKIFESKYISDNYKKRFRDRYNKIKFYQEPEIKKS